MSETTGQTPSAKEPMSDADFETIEAAVKETARGRWFLEEYARRNRNADTLAVLGAVERVRDDLDDYRAVHERRTPVSLMRAPERLDDIARIMARLKTDLSSEPGRARQAAAASHPLQSVSRASENLLGDILIAAERLERMTETLRANNGDEKTCNALTLTAAMLRATLSGAARNQKQVALLADALRLIDRRLAPPGKLESAEPAEIVEEKPAALAPSPALSPAPAPPARPALPAGRTLRDTVLREGALVDDMPTRAPSPLLRGSVSDREPVAKPSAPVNPRLPTLRDLDDLTFEEKTVLFA